MEKQSKGMVSLAYTEKVEAVKPNEKEKKIG